MPIRSWKVGSALLPSALLALSGGLTAQATCSLSREGARLVGGCDHPWFSGLELELAVADPLSADALLERLPVQGALVAQGRTRVDAEFVVTDRSGFAQVLLKPANPGIGWFTFDELELDGDTLRFRIDPDPTVPVTVDDVEIVRTALELLSDASRWHQEDDRECEDDRASDRWSLFCALREGSLRTTGEYNHRSAAMQALRHAIESRYPGRRWEHRLRDYNNLDDTSYEEVRELMTGMLEQFDRELATGGV